MNKVLFAGILLGLLSGTVRAEQAQVEKQYYAIYLGPAKLGYMKTTRTVTSKTVTTTVKLKFSIRRDKFAMSIMVYTKEVETPDGKPLSFRTIQDLAGSRQETRGEILPDGLCKITTNIGGQKKEKSLSWPKGALLSEGMRLLMLKKGFTPGTRYDALSFDPESAATQTVSVAVGPKEKIDLLGRITELQKITQTFLVGGSAMNMITYIDKDTNVEKMIIGMMGMEMSIVACDSAFAMSHYDNDVDFLKKLAVTAPQDIPCDAKKIKYTIAAVGGKELDFPRVAGQTVKRNGDGFYEITAESVKMPKGAKFPYKGHSATAMNALSPSTYIQSEAPEIKKLSEKAVGNAKDAAQAVRNIQNFVRKYIKRKDLSVGFASALEVARSRTGDCTEHAMLSAALCRAAGIPARVVMGVAYVDQWLNYKNVFLGHAWVLAYVGDKWVQLDAAVPSSAATRIILAVDDDNCGPNQFFSIINLLGYFKITQVDIEDPAPSPTTKPTQTK